MASLQPARQLILTVNRQRPTDYKCQHQIKTCFNGCRSATPTASVPLPAASIPRGPFRPLPPRRCKRQSDKSSSDADLWCYSVSDLKMIVGLEDERTVRFAVLSICWWETFLPTQHANRESFQAEQREFNRLYNEELQAATAVLGPPQLAGQDQDEHAHRWAAWRGRTGLLVLQQSAYDPQFGLDVNYWLHPWKGGTPQPTSPFVDWLFGVSGTIA